MLQHVYTSDDTSHASHFTGVWFVVAFENELSLSMVTDASTMLEPDCISKVPFFSCVCMIF